MPLFTLYTLQPKEEREGLREREIAGGHWFGGDVLFPTK